MHIVCLRYQKIYFRLPVHVILRLTLFGIVTGAVAAPGSKLGEGGSEKNTPKKQNIATFMLKSSNLVLIWHLSLFGGKKIWGTNALMTPVTPSLYSGLVEFKIS